MDGLYDGFDVHDDDISTMEISKEDDTTTPSMGTSYNMNDSIRPMTSNKSAGYSSKKTYKSTNNNKLLSGQNKKKNDKYDTLNKVQLIEKNVNKLLKESIFNSSSKQYDLALDFAKKARKKEREVIKFREKNGLEDSINTDLTISVLFNLGYIFQIKEMYNDALNVYNLMLKNNNKADDENKISSRIRVNIGNIYYKLNKYDLAIKMYRMAMDQIGSINKIIKLQIMRNIGNSFIKLGQYIDAIQSFENILDNNYYDEQSIFNLIISYYALGDKEKMKKGFIHLLNCSDSIPLNNSNNSDEYTLYIKTKWLKLSNYIKQSIQLIAPAIANNIDIYSGYDWLIQNVQNKLQQQLNNDHHLTSINKEIFNKIILEIIVSKGIAYLKDNKFELAINVFNEININNDSKLNTQNNNLSFINFLKCDYEKANKYAISAISYDRYNASALVNRANCLYIFGEYESAKEMYLEAIGVEADCIEAIFNLGLVCKKIGNYNDSLQAFKKLNKTTPKDMQIIYHISNLYELNNDYTESIKWYKILQSLCPTDPNILIKLANLYKIYKKDENYAYHNYLDSYNIYKCNIDVISWLGIWYINNELYENAIDIFKNANNIQSIKDIKWELMIASCYRRMRNYQKSINIYVSIIKQHEKQHNSNYDINIIIKCLQYLCTIMKQINHPELNKYQNKLNTLQQQYNNEQQYQQEMEQQSQQQTHQITMQTNDQSTTDKQSNNVSDDDDNDNWADVDIDDELLPS